METIIVNSLIGVVTVIFAVLAFGPALLSSDTRQTSTRIEEDLIISIETVPFDRPAPRSIAPRVKDDAHIQREAA